MFNKNRSLDLNFIENVLHLIQIKLDKLLKDFRPKNQTQLFSEQCSLVKQAWENVENQKVINTFNSFYKRLEVLEKNKVHNRSKY